MELTGSLNAIGYGLASIGGGIGVGLIFAAYMTSVARQPESQRTLQPMLFMGFAVVEALAILGLVLAFIV
ncbi:MULTISPECIES: ATP synthase F0 subunit C [Rothia]|uniref:ATP synthase subunit c n=1 Tax=Rothia amarae TaxID=169480 RepID=A0A7H2BM20_9MICC|nr:MULTISPECIES: ATP synthase F0 subunit C [Rothia]QNV40716.1 ATP synthase F0 subunit C [Rothia amarae]